MLPTTNDRRYRVDQPTPFPVLMLAPPDPLKPAECDLHMRDIEQKLRDMWRVTLDGVEVVAQEDALDALRHADRSPPRLLYYYGPASIHEGALCLPLQSAIGTTKWCPLLSRLQGWQRGGFQVVFLNLLQETPLPLGTTLEAMSTLVPLVITQTIKPAACREAQDTFIAWLHDILDGKRPLPSLHEKGHWSAVAWSNFAYWHIDVRGREAIPLAFLGHLLLNRTAERLLVNHAVDDLIDNNKRVTCMVAYAASGNRIDMFFPHQARDYLSSSNHA